MLRTFERLCTRQAALSAGWRSVHRIPSASFAVRPPRKRKIKCDPYGQDGLPLEDAKVEELLSTIEPEWLVARLEISVSI